MPNSSEAPAAAGVPAPAERQKIIIRTSVIGIVTNLLLSGFKAVVGLLSGSIAIVLDAVNNLSDALSSVVTIVGTRLAGRPADKRHPLGHGRIEYLTAMLVALLILYAGITALIQSIQAILHPETPNYSAATLIVVGAAIITKLILGRYVSAVGKRVHSDSLAGSGRDALNDAIISLSTLAAAVIFMIWGVSLEAWLGIFIAVMILKSGVELLQETLGQILGRRVDGEMTQHVKEAACRTEHVLGAYDLVLHNYGPDRFIGSIHVEVPDSLSAEQIDQLERQVAQNVYLETGVLITAVGIYSNNTHDDHAASLRTEITRMVESREYVLQTHGFYLDEARKRIQFDIVLDFAAPDREGLFREIMDEIREKFPEYEFQVTMDSDISG
jgi:cation diffusion facilitator family transporter